MSDPDEEQRLTDGMTIVARHAAGPGRVFVVARRAPAVRLVWSTGDGFVHHVDVEDCATVELVFERADPPVRGEDDDRWEIILTFGRPELAASIRVVLLDGEAEPVCSEVVTEPESGERVRRLFKFHVEDALRKRARIDHRSGPADLRAAVVASPGDDRPRLALAAALRGSPLGELIELQCRTAGSRTEADAERESQLVRQAARLLPGCCRKAIFRRGFLWGVTLWQEPTPAALAELAGREPLLVEVTFDCNDPSWKRTNPGYTIRELLATPFFAHVARVRVERFDWGPNVAASVIEDVARGPRAIESLSVERVDLHRGDWLEGKAVAGLRELELAGRFFPEFLEALVARGPVGLGDLTLDGRVPLSAVLALLDSPRLGSLRRLRVAAGADDARALFIDPRATTVSDRWAGHVAIAIGPAEAAPAGTHIAWDRRALAAPAPADEETWTRLVRAIAEEPDDDARRLVAADWLTGRGDPRGELITLACTGTDPGRQAALIAAHADAWGEPLAEVGGSWLKTRRFEYRRGFVESAAFAGGDLAWLTTLLGREPITELEAGFGLPAVERERLRAEVLRGAVPELAQIRKLTIAGSAHVLLASGHLGRVATLRLLGDGLSGVGLEAVSALRAGACRPARLVIGDRSPHHSSVSLEADAALALARSDVLARVESLIADDLSVAALADAPLGCLTELAVARRNTTEADLDPWPRMPALKTLRLRVWGPSLPRVIEILAARLESPPDSLFLESNVLEGDVAGSLRASFPRTHVVYHFVPDEISD
jgi:uncharacterized protein (TIGR02996 family)